MGGGSIGLKCGMAVMMVGDIMARDMGRVEVGPAIIMLFMLAMLLLREEMLGEVSLEADTEGEVIESR